MSRGEISCARRGCPNTVEWSGRGRPPKYCHDPACRRARARERVRRHRGSKGTAVRLRNEDAYPDQYSDFLDREQWADAVAVAKQMEALGDKGVRKPGEEELLCVSCSAVAAFVGADGPVLCRGGEVDDEGDYLCGTCAERLAEGRMLAEQYRVAELAKALEYDPLRDDDSPEDWGSAAD